MTVEYILLLAVSAVLILSDFVTHGPLQMMNHNGARLGMQVERSLVTGGGFFVRESGDGNMDWVRREN